MTDEIGRAQKDQDHLHDEVDRTCEELAHASRDSSDFYETMNAKLFCGWREVNTKRATHETICVEVRKYW